MSFHLGMSFQSAQEAVLGSKFGSSVVWRTLRQFVSFVLWCRRAITTILSVPCSMPPRSHSLFLDHCLPKGLGKGCGHGEITWVLPCTGAFTTGVIHKETNAVHCMCMWLWFTCEIVHSEQVLYLACLWNSSRRKRKHCMWNVPMYTCFLFRIQLYSFLCLAFDIMPRLPFHLWAFALRFSWNSDVFMIKSSFYNSQSTLSRRHVVNTNG